MTNEEQTQTNFYYWLKASGWATNYTVYSWAWSHFIHSFNRPWKQTTAGTAEGEGLGGGGEAGDQWLTCSPTRVCRDQIKSVWIRPDRARQMWHEGGIIHFLYLTVVTPFGGDACEVILTQWGRAERHEWKSETGTRQSEAVRLLIRGDWMTETGGSNKKSCLFSRGGREHSNTFCTLHRQQISHSSQSSD